MVGGVVPFFYSCAPCTNLFLSYVQVVQVILRWRTLGSVFICRSRDERTSMNWISGDDRICDDLQPWTHAAQRLPVRRIRALLYEHFLRTEPGRCELTAPSQHLRSSSSRVLQQPFREMIPRDDLLPPKAHRNVATVSFSRISTAS